MFDRIAFTENSQVLAKIDPASYATAQNSGWAAMADHDRVVIIMMVGLIAATGTLNLKVQKATDSSGTGAVDMSGKAITALADTADNIVVAIEVRAIELGSNFTHIRAVATPATAASILGVLVLGVEPHYQPVLQTNWTQAIK